MFCPQCGTWNRARAVRCTRCETVLPDLPEAPTERPDEELTALRRLTGNRYRVMRRIGGGGMANVYHAVHHQLGRSLALKVLHAHLAKEEEMRERFRREAEAAARLVHPHICGILDFGASPEGVYIVMPYLPGGSLADELARDRVVEPRRAAIIAAQMAVALDYAHRRGIVHRDVKPDNVLFDEDGYALITDFGIATARFHARLTGTGRAMGTPHYMSPEQAMGRLVDGRSDVYAVGVVLYEMLVGFPPFDGADAYSVSYKQVHEQPVPLETIDSRIDPALAAIVARALAKDPDARPQRGHELADALLGWLGDGALGGEARPAWLARRPATPASGRS